MKIKQMWKRAVRAAAVRLPESVLWRTVWLFGFAFLLIALGYGEWGGAYGIALPLFYFYMVALTERENMDLRARLARIDKMVHDWLDAELRAGE